MLPPLTISSVTALPTASLPPLYNTLHEHAASTRSLFLSLTPLATLQAALSALSARDPARALPLHGVPYVLKDNIDYPPHATTAACARFSSLPRAPAFVAALLDAAGAVCLGKVNMDQFACGLVGTRSPHGTPSNPRAPRHVPGGSSSASAVAVAAGLAAFSLGTDTAGSGRVPAAMNALVGLKPTRGLLSVAGVVPACQSLDCVSIFASCVPDAALLFSLLARYDPAHVFSRQPPSNPSHVPPHDQPVLPAFRFGVPNPPHLTFDADPVSEKSFEAAVHMLREAGGQRVHIDFEPFQEAAAQLYGGPFVAERFAAVGQFIKEHRQQCPGDFDDVVADIILASERLPAYEVFTAQERILHCKKDAEQTWEKVDVLVLPTVPRPVTLEEVRQSPVEVNSMLGTYTNFVNLMDYCAIAVPAPDVEEGQVPRGITIVAKAFKEREILALADRYHKLVLKQKEAKRLTSPSLP